MVRKMYGFSRAYTCAFLYANMSVFDVVSFVDIGMLKKDKKPCFV